MIMRERLTAHKRWLADPSEGGRLVAVEEDLSGVDLCGANLRSANLRGANLRSADLRGADLRGANLISANLSDADLRAADLRSAYLHDANLCGAVCCNADLIGADLSGATLRGVDLTGANLNDADLSGADLRAANLCGANLSGADLSGADLSGADLRNANLSDANLSDAKGYPCPSTWVDAQEVDPEGRGIIVYKIFGLHYPAPADWRVEPGAVITEVVNPDRGTECGSGINVAPWSWGGFNSNKPIWKLLIEWRDLCTLVVPFGTDGKARVGRATLLEEVE